MADYLSTKKREQVEEMKRRILAGEFNHAGAGFITAESTSVTDVIAQAVYQDEQGPWSLEDPHTELEIAQYELALAAHDAAKRAEWEAEQGETEWEYARGYLDADGRAFMLDEVSAWRPGVEAAVMHANDHYSIVIRRRKAGKWLPVEQEKP